MKKLLTGLAMMWALATGTEASAQELRTEGPEEVTKEIVLKQDSTCKDIASTINRFDATKLDSTMTQSDVDEAWEWIGIEPYPEDKWNWESGWDSKEKEKPELPVKFTISTWLWYSINWKIIMCNRIAWSWQLFKGTKWELWVYSHIDFDDPLNSKWSWKLVLSKTIYKWITLDWDYTFTGTWWNIFRMWIWYGWQIWKWQFWVKVYPLNTNGSPISAKVSVWTKVWKNGQINSFVFVDFKNMSYYSETEYLHQIAQWIALFAQARLWWILDWRITEKDSQQFVWWIRISIN